jgi:N-acetyl-gamma-glutamyl-phosphate reductase
MSAKLKSAVLGASGYSGLELARILDRHPRLEKPVLLRREGGSDGAKDLAEVFPELSGNGGYPLRTLVAGTETAGCAVTFSRYAT